MTRLVVVSNRVALGASAGGLAVGVRAALEETGGLWFGWSGETREEVGGDVTTRKVGPYTLATVDLSTEDYERYYAGFANRGLWPTLHNRLDLAQFDPDDETAYRRVNESFADHLARMIGADDLVWVHDYHLILLGAALRRRGIDRPLGYFLHTPFPPAEVIIAVPRFRELMDGLCSYDLIGFQSHRDLWNFRDLVEHELGGSAEPDGRLSLNGRRFRADVFPIGIDTEQFAATAASPEIEDQRATLAHEFGERRMIVGVDRLDYTKGLAERFYAFERLLADHPEHHRHVLFLQIAAPSREGVPEYEAMRRQLETLSGHINGRYSDVDWVPLHYINRAYDRAQLAAFFRLSRVGLITPLRDGMNLVAKEYAAAQDPEDPGVLVLSRFAGSADILEGPLLVSPYDTGAVAEAMHRALGMPLDERKARWTAMMDDLRHWDIHRWRESFVEALAATAAPAR